MPQPSRADASSPAILIVEDEAKFAGVLRQALQARGYRCSTALNGFEALDLVRASAPEVVVLDLSLPGVSGLELLQRIRHSAPQTKVVIVTGHAEEYSRLASQFGVTEIFEKPVTLDLFLAAIARVLPLTNTAD